MKFIRFAPDHYCFVLEIYYNCSIDEFKAIVAKKYKVDLSGTQNASAATYTLTKGKSQKNLVWLSNFKFDPINISLLSHELHHVVMSNLEDRGFTWTMGGDEAYAYYFQTMLMSCLKALKK